MLVKPFKSRQGEINITKNFFVPTPVEISFSDKSEPKDLVHATEHYWDLNHHLACALKYICREERKGDERLYLFGI